MSLEIEASITEQVNMLFCQTAWSSISLNTHAIFSQYNYASNHTTSS